MEKYGLMKYRFSNNLGDEIQGLAARQFLPRIDCYVERDNYDEGRSKDIVKFIANGWYSHAPELWPPSNENMRPLFIAFHITKQARAQFSSPQSIAYFKKMAPIGCRDYATLEFLQGLGIDAYFSGCMTLTLKKPDVAPNGLIYIVDLDDDISAHIPDHRKKDVQFVTHEYPKPLNMMKRIVNKLNLNGSVKPVFDYFYRKAEDLLKGYGGADFVITSRLHCALPCVAMGIPVYFVVPDENDIRYRGLADYTNFITRRELMDNPDLIDWDSPRPNPGDPSNLRSQMIEICTSYISGQN